MSDRTDGFLKFIDDVITKKIVYHLFDDEVEFLGCVFLSYLLALEITCSCFHDFIDKDLIDLVLPDVRRYVVVLTELEVMEFENTQNNALAKLPMLKLGECEMWEIRIKQYFHIQDYALWEVIENGNL
ncbi:hypothetical protein Tco_0556537 [Tanacetum coccineum]